MKIVLIALLYLIGHIVIILLYNQFKVIKNIGTIVLAYAAGTCIGIRMAESLHIGNLKTKTLPCLKSNCFKQTT